MKNIFTTEVTQEVIARINSLTPETKAQWGKMNVSQMIAHCCVAYEFIYTDKHKKPNAITRFFIKAFAKSMIVGDKPYPKNGRTAPQFIIADQREFNTEKTRLIDYLNRVQQEGEAHFDGKESLSLGKLSAKEWNVMFYKHINHHLNQFGA